MKRRRLWLALAGLGVGLNLLGMLSTCALPECARTDYEDAECRVVVENELARHRSSTGIEVRFQDPNVFEATSWDARGLVEEVEPGIIRARVAGPGRFAISLVAEPQAPAQLELILDNVDPAAVITVGPMGSETRLPAPDPPSTRRRITVDLPRGDTVWIRGTLDCPSRYRIAVTADIQTNPTQFERIADRLGIEARDAAAEGEPLVGLVLTGDVTESSRDDEFERMLSILDRIGVPVAVTPGNHDIYRGGRPHYNMRFGPGNHAFNVCSVRVALVDTGSGAIARSVEGRLPELLRRDGADFLILGMHHPPYAALTASGWSREDRAQHLLAEAAIAGADLIVAGHNHALHDFSEIPVGDVELREIIAGTAGAYQGLGNPRFGYVRLTFGSELETCFVEVPPPGYDESPNDELSARLPRCDD